MNPPPPRHRQDRREILTTRLFDDPDVGTWAVLDGATVPRLVRAIGTHRVESCCLFTGKLHPSMARVAPYLVRLGAGTEFTDWILERGWGRSWGILLRSRGELGELGRHLRRFLRVRDPEGRPLHFRYYDPRVLRTYLPTCNEQEMALLFGPVLSYAAESEAGDALLLFTPGEGAPAVEAVPCA